MAATWEGFSIQLPGQQLLEPIRSILETILTFLEIIKAVLDVIKAFLIAIPNPIQALVKALMLLLTTLVNTINQTGIYAYFDFPDIGKDPNLFKFLGGYQGFTSRFKGSLLDTRDPNRPQPISGFSQSGFLMIVADAADIAALMKLLKVLNLFFNRPELKSNTRFAAPANVKILPASKAKDPITSLAKVFSTPIGGVSLNWSLGGSVRPPDKGFQDLGGIIANEFVPPQWLIERSSTPLNGKNDVSAGGVGQVTWMRPTQHEIRGQPGNFMSQLSPVFDENGDPVIKFDTYITVLSGTDITAVLDAIVGELGLIQYFDNNNIQADTTYYYRIRAYTGTLDLSGTTLNWGGKSAMKQNPTTQEYYLPWPGTDLNMGKPSPVFRIRVPKIPPNFDVIQNLTRLFEAAFSLNFHQPPAATDKFDSNGNPINNTPITHLGYGSLLRQAGALAAFQAIPAVSAVSSALGTSSVGTLSFVAQPPTDPTTGSVVQQPWQNPSVINQAGRLAGIVGSALLEQGSSAIQQFQLIMQSLPGGALSGTTSQGLKGINSLSALVYEITDPGDPTTGYISAANFSAYVDAFGNASVRKNVLYAIHYVTSFTLGGTPPDWIQFSILRDIIPWSGQLLYDILAKIQALLDAFKSIFDEIIAFINLIERKITVLEQFIEYLISILDFILSLQAGFYLLFVPNTSGDIFQWFSLIDSAGGTPPPSGPGGYSAGVSLAYVAPNVSALAAAFSLIF